MANLDRGGLSAEGAAVSVPMRPSREEAEEAVRTLLRWAGDEPSREGLRDTPARVAKAFEQIGRASCRERVLRLV